jgi:hypothetical protein
MAHGPSIGRPAIGNAHACLTLVQLADYRPQGAVLEEEGKNLEFQGDVRLWREPRPVPVVDTRLAKALWEAARLCSDSRPVLVVDTRLAKPLSGAVRLEPSYCCYLPISYYPVV